MNRHAFRLDGRTIVVAVVAFLGFWLLRVGTSSGELSAGLQIAALVGGLVLFVGAAIFLFQAYRESNQMAPESDEVQIGQPALATFLFASVRSTPLWLGVRLYLGYEWFEAGRHKITDPAWMDGGAALQGFWQRAVTVPAEGRPPVTYDPYREYLQFMLDQGWYTWFSKVIAVGELLIGLGLIFGALTGIAAFSGALLNMSFMLAGTVSTNPVLFTLSILILLAWRVAGLIGLDRWLLPALGVPWRPSRPVPPASHTPTTPLPSRAT
jgi:thiosulfate dehydrogenase [quinone] large subunit